MTLFDIVFWKSKMGPQKYYCIVYLNFGKKNVSLASFEATTKEDLFFLLGEFNIKINPLKEEMFEKQLWLYECPLWEK